MAVAVAILPFAVLQHTLLVALVHVQRPLHPPDQHHHALQVQIILAHRPRRRGLIQVRRGLLLRHLRLHQVLRIVMRPVHKVVRRPQQVPGQDVRPRPLAVLHDHSGGRGGQPASPLAVDDGDAVGAQVPVVLGLGGVAPGPHGAAGEAGCGGPRGGAHLQRGCRLRVQHIVHPDLRPPCHVQGPRRLGIIPGVRARRPHVALEVQEDLVHRQGLPGEGLGGGHAAGPVRPGLRAGVDRDLHVVPGDGDHVMQAVQRGDASGGKALHACEPDLVPSLQAVASHGHQGGGHVQVRWVQHEGEVSGGPLQVGLGDGQHVPGAVALAAGFHGDRGNLPVGNSDRKQRGGPRPPRRSDTSDRVGRGVPDVPGARRRRHPGQHRTQLQQAVAGVRLALGEGGDRDCGGLLHQPAPVQLLVRVEPPAHVVPLRPPRRPGAVRVAGLPAHGRRQAQRQVRRSRGIRHVPVAETIHSHAPAVALGPAEVGLVLGLERGEVAGRGGLRPPVLRGAVGGMGLEVAVGGDHAAALAGVARGGVDLLVAEADRVLEGLQPPMDVKLRQHGAEVHVENNAVAAHDLLGLEGKPVVEAVVGRGRELPGDLVVPARAPGCRGNDPPRNRHLVRGMVLEDLGSGAPVLQVPEVNPSGDDPIARRGEGADHEYCGGGGQQAGGRHGDAEGGGGGDCDGVGLGGADDGGPISAGENVHGVPSGQPVSSGRVADKSDVPPCRQGHCQQTSISVQSSASGTAISAAQGHLVLVRSGGYGATGRKPLQDGQWITLVGGAAGELPLRHGSARAVVWLRKRSGRHATHPIVMVSGAVAIRTAMGNHKFTSSLELHVLAELNHDGLVGVLDHLLVGRLREQHRGARGQIRRGRGELVRPRGVQVRQLVPRGIRQHPVVGRPDGVGRVGAQGRVRRPGLRGHGVGGAHRRHGDAAGAAGAHDQLVALNVDEGVGDVDGDHTPRGGGGLEDYCSRAAVDLLGESQRHRQVRGHHLPVARHALQRQQHRGRHVRHGRHGPRLESEHAVVPACAVGIQGDTVLPGGEQVGPGHGHGGGPAGEAGEVLATEHSPRVRPVVRQLQDLQIPPPALLRDRLPILA
mmetsp:Transcript_95179/g.254456  ORF Transcript_95179/g.254456 Transcript_95179/m.254456 type:complete len:1093 (+) Transcript_95179:784-4062(+)